MAPGRKRDPRKLKKGNGNFSVGNKNGVIKKDKGSSVKKSKDKAVPKKKLKVQTTKWIDDVNETFTALHPKIAVHNVVNSEKPDKQNHINNRKEKKLQSIRSDVADAEVTSTITNMASLLEQS